MDDKFFDDNREHKYRSFKEIMDEKRNSERTGSVSPMVKNEELKRNIPQEQTVTETTGNTEFNNKSSVINENYRQPEKKKKKPWGRMVAALLIVSIAGGASIGAGYGAVKYFAAGKETAEEAENNNTQISLPSSAVTVSTNGAGDAVEVINKVFPSVVNISTNGVVKQNYYGYVIPYSYTSAGSGIIFSEDDENVYIATNNHVIEEAESISVTIGDENGVSAKVVGTDSSADLAVISISKADLKAEGIESVTIAEFGDSDSISVGQSVIAIGNALGEGKVATGGMISSKLKTITIDGVAYTVIQTDSAINPGNSGGALVDYEGKVIGINTAKSSSSTIEGVGYAIPSNKALPILNDLLENGTAPKPYLGIVGMDVTDEVSQKYGLPKGAYIAQVLENSGAADAGLREGDIITEFNGEKVTDMETLKAILADLSIGDIVSIKVIRNGSNTINTNITIYDANNL